MRKFTELQKIRHKNLRKIIESKGYGFQKRLADLLDQDPTYTGQFAGKRPNRPISDDMARKIEESLDLIQFSLDGMPEESIKDNQELNNSRMLLAVKFAQKTEKYLKEPSTPEQFSRMLTKLYNGDPYTIDSIYYKSEDPKKELMVQAGVLAHETLQKVKDEPGVDISNEEARKLYAEIIEEIYIDLLNEFGKLRNEHERSHTTARS
ncbi:hypothetical protein [Aliikangiella coralliicola]|uniref:Uncharacterized protein n=1 Tax=Aliikangiella coralliicola TaxID=2592383 RepID=A0A545U038_9GAMM|nr:hypothetical protein [Aliikangiella coralliicola]TQV82830.1 hypothetical protein FLL46_23975 [Aliikangiella coralliicola]